MIEVVITGTNGEPLTLKIEPVGKDPLFGFNAHGKRYVVTHLPTKARQPGFYKSKDKARKAAVFMTNLLRPFTEWQNSEIGKRSVLKKWIKDNPDAYSSLKEYWKENAILLDW